MCEAMPSVGVFCGSRPHSEFVPLAEDLGRQLAERGVGLVYGGGGAGLMGAVSAAAHDAGGHVVGVVPQGLFLDERTEEARGELHMVRGMHERKALMYRLAGGFIVLPGGLGTLEEALEAATWSQLGLHHRDSHKPVVLLNWPSKQRPSGYWRRLRQQLKDAEDDGFLDNVSDLIQVAADTDEAFDLLGIPRARPELSVRPDPGHVEPRSSSSMPESGSAA